MMRSHHQRCRDDVPDLHEEVGFEDDTESVEWSVQDDREVDISSEEEVEIVVARPRGPDLREAFSTLDDVNVIPIFHQRAAVTKTVPRFLRGPFRNALKIAMEEVLSSDDVVGQSRGWKLFVMIPRMLLHRPPGGGLIAKEKLVGRFELLRQRHWAQLDSCEQVV